MSYIVTITHQKATQ